MYKDRSFHQIFIDIHEFIIDFVKVLEITNENSNLLTITLCNDSFLLPATMNNFSRRADELKNSLQRQIRILAQTRRNNISKGLDIIDTILQQNISSKFDMDFKNHLEQLQNQTISRSIKIIIDSLELYDDLIRSKSTLNKTFCLLPVLHNIQKQLCCISRNIQKILDENTSGIEEHLRKLQQKFNTYHQEMRDKLERYISSNIRPPVLVIPCPKKTTSREFFMKFQSTNKNTVDQNLVDISSEDSLSSSTNPT